MFQRMGFYLSRLVAALCAVVLVQAQDLEPRSTSDVVKEPKEPKRLISLAESINITQRNFADPEVEKIRRQYWETVFEDIRTLISTSGTGSGSASRANTVLNQWKLLSQDTNNPKGGLDFFVATPASSSQPSARTNLRSEPFNDTQNSLGQVGQPQLLVGPPRFEGFPSWERMLQDWSDDIQEYLDQASEESEGGYLLGNYGRPASPTKSTDVGAAKSLPVVPVRETISARDLQPIDSAMLYDNPEDSMASKKIPMPIPAPAKNGEDVLPHTDVSDKSKRILIVTTAALPWKTGTAVNPLLRAAYMTKDRAAVGGSVTLMVPWLERQDDQARVYGTANMFATPADQEEYIRTWLRESAAMPQASVELNIAWYTAWQTKVENSIYSMGDITALVSADDIDICILEEPEHLNWYRAPGESWTKKFKHVVGILHTNYFSYALDQPAALIRAPAMRLLCSWMCRAHCHRVIKLSGTLDKVAPEKELVENVHGVRGTFLDVGVKVRGMLEGKDSIFSAEAEPMVYFIGKMLWSKGLGSLMELLKYAEESANLTVKVNMYGGGPDMVAASKKSEMLGLDMPFHGPLDHAELAYTQKIFVNPSTSEVLCTTTAEALAMGKFVIVPSHKSNDFFESFPNCLTYASKEEFVGELYYAMTHAPEPLTEEFAYALSWEAATERLEAAACIPTDEFEKMQVALASENAGIEISLPPFVENEENRKEISKVFRFSRLRYRQFRTRLSTEIQENKVLPKSIRQRLVAELDKRLDLNIDELIDSPKLRLKLSPAELDKSLLELYDNVSESPGGDILRLIGGGGFIAMQNLYMRRRAERDRWRKLREGVALDIFPTYVDDVDVFDDKDTSVTQLIRRSLRRNIPSMSRETSTSTTVQPTDSSRNTPTMCYGRQTQRPIGVATWSGFRPPVAFPRRSSQKFSILI